MRTGLCGRMLACPVPGKLLQYYKVSGDTAAMRSALRRQSVQSRLPGRMQRVHMFGESLQPSV